MSWQPGYRPPGVGKILFVRLAVLGIIPALILAVVLVSAVGGRLTEALGGPGDVGPEGLAGAVQVVTVKRVIDGDTFDSREAGRIRLIGVDTPETKHPTKGVECYGPQASAATRQAMPPGITVRLLFEASRDGGVDARPRARTDRYGRTLAYVYLTDGTFWNRTLVARGLARARYYAPNDDHRADFEAAQTTAAKAGKGGWSACAWRS